LGRNIVSDQTVLEPVETGVRVETRCEEGVFGTNTVQDTVNPANSANQDRIAGDDRVRGG